jgi:diacylglycerol kinase (ATP)
MRRLKVIVNPIAGRGYGAQAAPLIAEHLRSLGAVFDLVPTRFAGEATALAERAAAEGYDIVVAVGGDGTSHEVVNGLMSNDHRPILGCIPAGSGNDFATMNGAPSDLRAACELLIRGQTRPLDLGYVEIDGHYRAYYSNAVGIGFDALVTMEATNHHRLRGLALYIPVVLKTIFQSMQPTRMQIVCDEETIQKTTLVTIVANGPREGGTFFVAPQARTDDGLLNLMMTENMSRLGMLAMVPRFMNGTHVQHRAVATRLSRRITISSPDPLYVHVDGEIPCEPAHRIEVQVVPACLQILTA